MYYANQLDTRSSCYLSKAFDYHLNEFLFLLILLCIILPYFFDISFDYRLISFIDRTNLQLFLINIASEDVISLEFSNWNYSSS